MTGQETAEFESNRESTEEKHTHTHTHKCYSKQAIDIIIILIISMDYHQEHLVERVHLVVAVSMIIFLSRQLREKQPMAMFRKYSNAVLVGRK